MFFAQTEPTLQKEFIDTGKAKLVFKTLAFIGQESVDAGEAAACAADQGKFWPMHDAIYSAEVAELAQKKSNENSGNLTRSFFASEADKLGMNKTDFLSCYDSKKYASLMTNNMTDAGKAMGSQVGTPALFVIKDGKATQVNQTNQGPFDIAEYERLIGK
jgi:protein-disulfide isomerase